MKMMLWSSITAQLVFGLRHEGNVGREAEEEDKLVVELVERATVKVAKKKEIRTEKLVEVNNGVILSLVYPSNWALELGVKIQTGCKAISCS